MFFSQTKYFKIPKKVLSWQILGLKIQSSLPNWNTYQLKKGFHLDFCGDSEKNTQFVFGYLVRILRRVDFLRFFAEVLLPEKLFRN
jgi:hypothetical protein